MVLRTGSTGLLRPQRDHRIHACRSARWQKGGERRRRDENERDANHDADIPWLDAVQERRDQLSTGERDAQADRNADDDGSKRPSNYRPHDIPDRCAERDANSELVRSLADRIRHRAVHADGCDEQCQQTEDAEQQSAESKWAILWRERILHPRDSRSAAGELTHENLACRVHNARVARGIRADDEKAGTHSPEGQVRQRNVELRAPLLYHTPDVGILHDSNDGEAWLRWLV